jgi:hypothetical protein
VLRTEDGGSFPVHSTLLFIHSDLFRFVYWCGLVSEVRTQQDFSTWKRSCSMWNFTSFVSQYTEMSVGNYF